MLRPEQIGLLVNRIASHKTGPARRSFSGPSRLEPNSESAVGRAASHRHAVTNPIRGASSAGGRVRILPQ